MAWGLNEVGHCKRRQLRFPEQRSHFFGKFSIIRHGPQNQTTLRRVDGARGGPEGSLACNGPLSAMGLPGLQPQQIFTSHRPKLHRQTLVGSQFPKPVRKKRPNPSADGWQGWGRRAVRAGIGPCTAMDFVSCSGRCAPCVRRPATAGGTGGPPGLFL